MKALALFALSLLPFPLNADIADEIKASLSPFEVLHGNFRQSKSIRILKNPLKSSGSFVLVKGKGVLWKSLKPMPSLLKVTPDAISQFKNGKVAFQMKSDEQPALKLIGKVLFAVFSADVSELKKHFEISGSLKNGHWEATLLPKEAWVGKVAKEIKLEGGKTLDTLRLAEANGDATVISFVDVRLKAPLSADEKALIE